MGRRFEQRKIHRQKNVKQVRRARLEGQPRCSVAGFDMLTTSALSTMSK
jgi:hypothetical protein